MVSGRSIRIFLAEGSPTGLLTAEVSNWTGKFVVCPRTQLGDLRKRPDVARPGTYMLVGPDPEASNRQRVYLGESENVLERVIQHDRDATKDFWTRSVLVVSKDENLTKSHVLYLESRLVQLARQGGRAAVENAQGPPPPSLPEADVADMEHFLEQVQMVLPVLGFTFAQDKPAVSDGDAQPRPDASPVFGMSPVGTRARARQIGDEFVVFKGSTARKEGTRSWKFYRALRDELVQEGKLAASDVPELLVFAEDVPFSSPSAAATMVAARDENGRTAWRVEDTGQTYADWHEARVATVDAASGPDAA